mmetsp:Transcript_25333/g.25073  ORF Transcript_25333/g.25073 Transcript_25333/m.25073 type:complete len:106 (+) Transcript_25333:32-349(+)
MIFFGILENTQMFYYPLALVLSSIDILLHYCQTHLKLNSSKIQEGITDTSEIYTITLMIIGMISLISSVIFIIQAARKYTDEEYHKYKGNRISSDVSNQFHPSAY